MPGDAWRNGRREVESLQLLYDAEIGEEFGGSANQDVVVITMLPHFGVSPLLRDATREAVTLTAIGYCGCNRQKRNTTSVLKTLRVAMALRRLKTKGGG